MNVTEHGDALVVCVVLNFNGAADTIDCVRSLQKQTHKNLEIVIVDNQSTDDSVQALRGALPGMEILEAGRNHGFAAGCNVGIVPALARGAAFVWLLNNDTIVPPDTLTKLLAAAGQDPKAGIIGTVLYYMHDPKRVQAWGGGRVNRACGFGTHFLKPTPLGSGSFLTFASALLRREVFADAGLLDDGYFMYFEDSDYCFRAREAGWELAVAGDTAVLHKEGGSQKTRSQWADRITTASGMRFLQKHGNPRSLAPWMFVITRLAKRMILLDVAGMRGVWHGVKDWLRGTPRAFQTGDGPR